MSNKEELKQLASLLSEKHLAFANGIINGKTQEQAYIDAGYKGKGARASSSQILTNPNIAKYLELSRQESQEVALADATVSETEWINNQKRLLSMSFGDEKSKKVMVIEGEAVAIDVKETNLAAANKSQELIARRFGWLTDNKNVKQEPISFHIDLGD